MNLLLLLFLSITFSFQSFASRGIYTLPKHVNVKEFRVTSNENIYYLDTDNLVHVVRKSDSKRYKESTSFGCRDIFPYFPNGFYDHLHVGVYGHAFITSQEFGEKSKGWISKYNLDGQLLAKSKAPCSQRVKKSRISIIGIDLKNQIYTTYSCYTSQYKFKIFFKVLDENLNVIGDFSHALSADEGKYRMRIQPNSTKIYLLKSGLNSQIIVKDIEKSSEIKKITFRNHFYAKNFKVNLNGDIYIQSNDGDGLSSLIIKRSSGRELWYGHWSPEHPGYENGIINLSSFSFKMGTNKLYLNDLRKTDGFYTSEL
jgi:hypothetical protein